MKIRTIKPDFWSSSKTTSVPREVRLLFIGLWNESDDEGRLLGSPKRLAGSLFPNDEDVDGKVIDGWLAQLAAAGLIVRYDVKAVAYVAVLGFNEHQKIDRRYPSRLPPPPLPASPTNNTAGPADVSERTADASEGPVVKTALESGIRNLETGRGKLEVGVQDAAPPEEHPPAPVGASVEAAPAVDPEPTIQQRAERRESDAVLKSATRNGVAARAAAASAVFGRPQTVTELLALRVVEDVDGRMSMAPEGKGKTLREVWTTRNRALDGKGEPRRPTVAEVLERVWDYSLPKPWKVDADGVGTRYLAWWSGILADEAGKPAIRIAWERDGGTAGVGDPDRARARRRHHELQGLGRDLPPFDTWFAEVWSRGGAAEDIAPSTPAGSGARPAGPRSGGVLRPADIDAQMAMAHADRDEGAGAAGLALLRAATTKPVQVRAIEGDDIEVQPC